jgi:long-chain acyl-CoA synthetase
MMIDGESTLSARLRQVLEIDPEATAVWDQGRAWRWRDITRTRAAIDAAVSSYGLSQGARIGIVLRTTFAGVASEMALLASGHTLYTLSPMAGDEKLAADVRAGAIDVLLAEDRDWQRPGLREAALSVGVPSYSIWASLDEPLEAVGAPDAAETAPRVRTADRDPAIANVMMTSGTTGTPKRIPISYADLQNMLAAVRHYSPATRQAQDGLTLRPRPAIVSSPLVHSSGFGGALRALAESRPLALLERFTPEGWTQLIEQFRSRTAALPPAALRMILDAGIGPDRLQSLRAIVVGSAALDPRLADEFEGRYHVPLLPNYGATEFPGGLAGWTLSDYRGFRTAKPGSVGRAHPGVELRIERPDESADGLPDGQGVLLVRTPATAGRTADGWVRTSDLASIDADGFLFIHGRVDEAIVRGGFKIIPRVVEEVLEQHPAVVSAGVIGIPDDRLGAVPVAAVETRASVSEQELRSWAHARLAAYQVPVEIRVLEKLPRTPSLKVSKPDLLGVFGGGNVPAERGDPR